MQRSRPSRVLTNGLAVLSVLGLFFAFQLFAPPLSDASSHREAPLISNDPQADNTDVYAFVSPDDPSTVTIIANYIPLELPEGGPNYNTFGENIRYEIHIKNQTSVGALGTATDDLTYRFTFDQENEDPTTFFNIRLGAQNLKTTYTLERSTDGGSSFQTIVSNGVVPANNIGPRSIEDPTLGLGSTYDQLTQDAIITASTGETVFAGPRDDPFFVDLGGVFDVGGFRSDFGTNPSNADNARDAVAGFNTHSLALQIPISTLQKDGMTVDQATDILDPDFVIGVWASASRPQMRTLSTTGDKPTHSGPWVQVSRLGMPLTNEVIIPIGEKDHWNATSPYDTAEQDFDVFFANPELALYMGNGAFGPAVPGLSEDLVIAMNSYPAIGDPDGDGQDGFNFNTGEDGVFDLIEAGIDLSGTAFAVPLKPAGTGSPSALAGDNEPRRVDILPIFRFGVPNLIPYQLATGKTGGPLSDGKPFINNFLPITQTGSGDLYGGDMLRLNMAVPPTGRNSQEFQDFAHMGLIRAAVLGLTDPAYNTTANLEFIPHMDGFPNGRRLEDDATTIELQAVGGLVLAAVGLPFDDAVEGDYSDLVSQMLVNALGFVAGPTANDVPLLSYFPYMANPHRGYDYVKQLTAEAPPGTVGLQPMGIGVPEGFLLNQNYPNPFIPSTTIQYQLANGGRVLLDVYDVRGRLIQTLVDEERPAGTHEVNWDAARLASGTYLYRLQVNDRVVSTRQATLIK